MCGRSQKGQLFADQTKTDGLGNRLHAIDGIELFSGGCQVVIARMVGNIQNRPDLRGRLAGCRP